jgi:hypothetical protein
MKMKFCFLASALALVAATGSPGAWADTEVDAVGQQVAQAIQSKDAKQVMDALPLIEKLWPQKPDAYFASVNDAAGALDAATATAGARTAISNLYAGMIEKPLPNTPEAAVPYLEQKKNSILYFLNFREVREDKTNLLALARYVGTIRSQIITNYVPKQVGRNSDLDASPAQAQALSQQNEQNMAYNQWQESLALADSLLTFQLLHDASSLSAGRPENNGFARDVAAAAHLTADEAKQLK